VKELDSKLPCIKNGHSICITGQPGHCHTVGVTVRQPDYRLGWAVGQ